MIVLWVYLKPPNPLPRSLGGNPKGGSMTGSDEAKLNIFAFKYKVFLWESFENHLRIIWESFENHLRIIWESFENYVRIVWELYENCVRIVWELSYNHLLIKQKSHKNHLRIIWESFENCVRIIWELCENWTIICNINIERKKIHKKRQNNINEHSAQQNVAF